MTGGARSAGATLERIRESVGDLPSRAEPERDGEAVLEVEREGLHPLLSALKERASFESVTFVTGVDRHPARPRYELVHQLRSLAHGDRIRVRTRLHGEAPSARTCTDLWPGASFMERECYDMFGIVFEGHPNLKRLLMPEEYGHHPLRKDFPHQGIEPDRLYREWDADRRKAYEAR